MWIQKHMRRYKAQKAKKQRYHKCFCICYNKHIYNCLLELFLFAMLNLVKLLCTFFSYLFFIFTEQHNLLLNMCCLQVTLLASFVKTWRGMLLQCGYRSTCPDIKLIKLRRRGIRSVFVFVIKSTYITVCWNCFFLPC